LNNPSTPPPGTHPGPLVPGDPVPPISLPDAAGATVFLKNQNLSGLTQVICFTPTADPVDNLVPETLDKIEATVIQIVSGAPTPTASPEGVTLVFDPAGETARLFGLAAGGMAIVGPNGRLIDAHAAVDIPLALDICEAVFAGSSPSVATMQAPVVVIPDVIEPELRAELIDYWAREGDKMENTVSSAAGVSQPNDRYKVRKDVLLLDEKLFTRVKDRMIARVFPELFRATHFKTANMEALRIGCYDGASGGRFTRHRDNATRYTANRKIAMSLNLSGDYEGGELRFPEYGRTLYKPDAGAAVVFSCTLLHEALPVTKGRRFAMFSFFTDAEGDALNKQMQQQGGIREYGMKT